MRDELQKQIFEKYPEMFPHISDPEYPYRYFSIDCGNGWYDLVDSLCAFIYNKHKNDVSQYEWNLKNGNLKEGCMPPELTTVAQIKEKFGGLRFYTNGTDSEEVRGAISFAEAMSYKICDTCSKPGKVGGKGWVTTLCETCRLDEDNRRSYSGPTSVAPGQLKIG